MKKKKLSVLFAVLLLVSIFSSCSKATATEPVPAETQPSAAETVLPFAEAPVSPETVAPSATNTETAQDVAASKPVSETKSSDTAASSSKPAATTPVKTPVKPASQTPAPVTEPAAEPAAEPAETDATAELSDTEIAQNSAAYKSLVTVDKEKVMSLDTDKGLLSIRYFLLYSDKKSGDSILVRTPSGKNILIDSGVPDSADQLVGYLKQLGIEKLDILINTHAHADHIGGMPTLINTFEVGDYYKNPREYTSSNYTKTMQALADKNVPVHVVVEGDEIDLGDGLLFHVYNPPKDMDPALYSNMTTQTNCESLVLMLTYQKIKVLFCGDLYQPAEVDMIARYPEGTFDADIVHAPHHGASTSSSIDYVIATTPQIAVMSTNSFQSQATYDAYVAYDAVVVANSINGNILITTDGDTVHAFIEEQLDPADVPKYSTGDN